MTRGWHVTGRHGTKPSPFLVTRTLYQLALDEGGRFPLAAQADIEGHINEWHHYGRKCYEVADAVEYDVVRKILSTKGMSVQLAIRTLDGINLDPNPSVNTLEMTCFPSTGTLSEVYHSHLGRWRNPHQTDHFVSDCNFIRSSFWQLLLQRRICVTVVDHTWWKWEITRLGSVFTLNGGFGVEEISRTVTAAQSTSYRTMRGHLESSFD